MRLQSRFRRVGRVTRVWRSEAFKVMLEWQLLEHLGFEEGSSPTLAGE